MATNFKNRTEGPLKLPQWEDEIFQFEDVNAAFETINGHAKDTDKAISLRAALATELIADRVYQGVDLTQEFADEIAQFSDVWAWIQSRARAGLFVGIHIGDYIPFIAGGNSFKAEVAGMDTYYRYGDVMVGHHIDFITRDCWPEAQVWNKCNYNNGTTVSPAPWLASNIYAWLNSLKMQVPTTAAASPQMTEVDYRTTGVYDKLPQELKNVIVQKRSLLSTRYTAGSLLVDDNSWVWADMGYLWLPSEVEVYGRTVWGTVTSTLQGFSSWGGVQYPIFAMNMHRIKAARDGDMSAGGRSHWWLSSVSGGNSTNCASVSSNGNANHLGATTAGIRAPLCFRVA